MLPDEALMRQSLHQYVVVDQQFGFPSICSESSFLPFIPQVVAQSIVFGSLDS